MKKISTLMLICLTLIAKADYWTQKADFGGTARYGAIGFSIGNKGYIGTGVDSLFSAQNDFWEWDQATNTWTQKANFAGTSRSYAAGFSIGNKGYIGGGTYPNTSDFWEYDPALNTWIQKSHFTGIGRLEAVGFSIGSKGYFGTGVNDLVNFTWIRSDLWEYDPATDSWSQKADMPTVTNFYGLVGASAFSIGNKGYVGTGLFNPIVYFTNYFWEYDPVTNAWTQKANVGTSGIYQGVGFSIGNKGYIGTGVVAAGPYLKYFFEYDPVNDTWSQKTSYPGFAFARAVGFSIGTKGYIGTGGNLISYFQRDFWEYTPDSSTAIDEPATSNLQFEISPNPVKNIIVISYPLTAKENLEVTIINALGKKVFETQLSINNNQSKISLAGFSKGIYFVEVSDGKEKAVRKFLKE